MLANLESEVSRLSADRSLRALVTGGAGFIGPNLVQRLLGFGCEVTILDNLFSGYRNNIEGLSGVRLVDGDVRDAATVDAAVAAGVDTVFHLAASVGNKRSIDSPVTDAEINVIGTIRVY